MIYTYANNDQAVQGRRQPAHRPARVAGHEQRGELAHAGRHARARSRLSRRRRKSTIRTSRSTRTRATTKTNRIIANAGFTLTPFSWGYLKTNIGTDAYTSQNLMLRHPESAMSGSTRRHPRHQRRHHAQHQRADAVQRQQPRRSARDLSISGLVGNSVLDQKSTVDGVRGHQLPRSEFRLDQQRADTSRAARSSRSGAS